MSYYMDRSQDPNYIYNPKSGRWVKRSGKIGRALVAAGTTKPKPAAKPVVAKPAGKPSGKPCNNTKPQAQDPDYICNPKTGRWVKRSGKVGQSLAATKPAPKPAPKPASKPTVPTGSRMLTDHIKHVASTQAGKKIGEMGGCFCPPHKGHYQSLKNAIRDIGLDVLLVSTINREDSPRHGTPRAHSIRVLSMYARQIMAELAAEGHNVEVYIMPNTTSQTRDITTYGWVSPDIGKFYDIQKHDTQESLDESLRKKRTLDRYGRVYFKQLTHNKYDPASPKVTMHDKYEAVDLLRDKATGLSATKFSKCLAHYQQNPTPANRKACHKFIDHLSPSDIEAYLDDILQYPIE